MPLILGLNGPMFVPSLAGAPAASQPPAPNECEPVVQECKPGEPGLAPDAQHYASAPECETPDGGSGLPAVQVPECIEDVPVLAYGTRVHNPESPALQGSGYIDAWEAEPDPDAFMAEVVSAARVLPPDLPSQCEQPQSSTASSTDCDQDLRVRYNGTCTWWEMRGYDPPLARLLVQYGVQPGDVRPRAPKALHQLMASALAQPYGPCSASIRAQVATMLIHGTPNQRVGAMESSGETTTATVVRGSHPPRQLPRATSHEVAVPPEDLVLSATVEYAEKVRQAELLAGMLGTARVAAACGFNRQEVWERLPKTGLNTAKTIWLKHATAFSAGLLQGVRRALSRLTNWLELNALDDLCTIDGCEGGVLAWFVLD